MCRVPGDSGAKLLGRQFARPGGSQAFPVLLTQQVAASSLEGDWGGQGACLGRKRLSKGKVEEGVTTGVRETSEAGAGAVGRGRGTEEVAEAQPTWTLARGGGLLAHPPWPPGEETGPSVPLESRAQPRRKAVPPLCAGLALTL